MEISKIKTNTRRRIINKSLQMHSNDSYKGCSFKQIADFVGITVRSLYNYFPNKQSLSQALINSVIEHYCEKLDSLVRDSRKLFAGIIMETLDLVSYQIERRQPLFLQNSLDEIEGGSGSSLFTIKEGLDEKIHQIVDRFIERGQAEEYLTRDFPRDPFLNLLQSALFLYIKKRALENSAVENCQNFRISIMLLIKGIATEKGRLWADQEISAITLKN